MRNQTLEVIIHFFAYFQFVLSNFFPIHKYIYNFIMFTLLSGEYFPLFFLQFFLLFIFHIFYVLVFLCFFCLLIERKYHTLVSVGTNNCSKYLAHFEFNLKSENFFFFCFAFIFYKYWGKSSISVT